MENSQSHPGPPNSPSPHCLKLRWSHNLHVILRFPLQLHLRSPFNIHPGGKASDGAIRSSRPRPVHVPRTRPPTPRAQFCANQPPLLLPQQRGAPSFLSTTLKRHRLHMRSRVDPCDSPKSVLLSIHLLPSCCRLHRTERVAGLDGDNLPVRNPLPQTSPPPHNRP